MKKPNIKYPMHIFSQIPGGVDVMIYFYHKPASGPHPNIKNLEAYVGRVVSNTPGVKKIKARKRIGKKWHKIWPQINVESRKKDL